jgi:plastocyanin domain-containing protein
MSQKTISIILLSLAFGFFIFKSFGGSRGTAGNNVATDVPSSPTQNVRVVDGKQVVDITARGGYSPRKTTAKAGIPTVLRVSTNGSYDCSVALRIPKLNIAKNLEPTGTEEIDLGTPVAGVMRGLCGMGMYSFEINFQS